MNSENKAKKLYLVESEEGLVKIGYSEDPERRIYSLPHGDSSSLELKVSVELPRAEAAEKQLHREFTELNVHGEWFELGEETTEKLVERLEGLDGVPPDHRWDVPEDLDDLDEEILDVLLEGRDAGDPWGVATPAVVRAVLEERGYDDVPVRQTINNRMRNLQLAGHLSNRYGKGEYEFVSDPREE